MLCNMVLQDLRYALRTLAKRPAFLAAAVLALGLGIGANTTVFSFVNAYLLRPLPSVRNPDRVVMVHGLRRGYWTGVSHADFLDWQQQGQAVEAWVAIADVYPILTGAGEPERVDGARVSAGFFAVFGLQPVLGRAFLPGEDAPGAEPVVLISQGLWQRRFGARPDAIGQSVLLDRRSHKVIGVMPTGFRHSWSGCDFWAPLQLEGAQTARGRQVLDVLARLKPGVSVATAQAEMDTIARRLEMQYPDTNSGLRMRVRQLREYLGSGPRSSILIMLGVVGFVLLIACANVANLLLARATARAREVAIRGALGATRLHIIRHMLTESVVIALLGGLLGMALGYGGAKILQATIPSNYQPINPDLIDGTVLAFTSGLALLTGLLFGAGPAAQLARTNANEILKEGGRGSGGGARGRLRNALVVAEISLAIVLLLGAGLLIKSFNRLQQVDPGFRAENLLTAHVWLPDAKYPTPELRAAFFRDLVERISGLPGVQSAAAATAIPFAGSGSSNSFVIEGQAPPSAGQQYLARTRSITPEYLRTMGIPLRRGRHFTHQDAEGAPPVAIINEAMARRYFAGENALGKRVKWGKDAQSASPWRTIVGLAGDVKPFGLDSQPVPEMYVPCRQEPRAAMFLTIRTRGSDPSKMVSAVRAELRNLDREQPMASIRSMRSIIEESLTVPKYMTWLLAIFAGIAMVMAAMGIYGVMSYSVSQRTHELGVRLALGAGRASVIRLVLKNALWLTLIGAAIGVPAAAAATRMLAAYLYGVGARDPVTFTLIPLALGAVALLASYVPARRATRVDPVVALRHE